MEHKKFIDINDEIEKVIDSYDSNWNRYKIPGRSRQQTKQIFNTIAGEIIENFS